MAKDNIPEEIINKVINLRQHGYTISEIKALHNLGRGTISKYIQGIKIFPEFQGHWKAKKMSSTIRSQQEKSSALIKAGSLIKKITKKDKLIIATCLYWAEGTKKDFSISNTDPCLIKTFIECLNELGVEKERLRITIRIYEDLDKEKVCKFWASFLDIPLKSIRNVNILKGKKVGKLEYGMCRIRVTKAGKFLKLLHALRETIIEKMPSSFNG